MALVFFGVRCNPSYCVHKSKNVEQLHAALLFSISSVNGLSFLFLPRAVMGSNLTPLIDREAYKKEALVFRFADDIWKGHHTAECRNQVRVERREYVSRKRTPSLSLSLCFFPLFLPVLLSRTFFLARKKTIDFASNVGLTLVVVVVVVSELMRWSSQSSAQRNAAVGTLPFLSYLWALCWMTSLFFVFFFGDLF